MSTSYPSNLDNLTNPTGTLGETQSTVSHVAQHQNANDAIEAIEAVLGINPQGVSVTVRQRLEAIEAAITALGTSSYTSLPDGSITTAKLGTNAVTTAKIADDQVTASKLTTDSVTTSKIQNNAVTQAKLAANLTLPVICTSTTRPSSYAGLRIYETNTSRELLHDGTGWIIMSEPAQSFTPVFTNLTVSNGTLVASYHRSDGWCDFEVALTFGSSTAVTGRISFSMPTATATNSVINGVAYITDTGTSVYPAIQTTDGTKVYLDVINASTTYGSQGITSATVPFTFATGDYISFHGRYRMTTRYS